METKKLYKSALTIAFFVMIYNIIESIISIYYGYTDESLTLFGFGFDSAVEVASNLGIIYMIQRIQENSDSDRSNSEKSALQITGWGFYILSIVLLIGIFFNLINDHKPINTSLGIVISMVSILVMLVVVYNQMRIGKKLHSAPIIADAKCTLVCVYMSLVLLVSSGIYYFTGFQYADVIGSLGLIYFSIKEGKECFENAKNNKYCSC